MRLAQNLATRCPILRSTKHLVAPFYPVLSIPLSVFAVSPWIIREHELDVHGAPVIPLDAAFAAGLVTFGIWFAVLRFVWVPAYRQHCTRMAAETRQKRSELEVVTPAGKYLDAGGVTAKSG